MLDTFQRVEDKYPLTYEQANKFLKLAKSHLKKDIYFQYTVHSIYYDTHDTAFLIQGMEKPTYKMKLRLRSYGEPDGYQPVWLETKKKYGDIVYKRRIPLHEQEAMDYLTKGIPHSVKNHTAQEIDYILRQYPLEPKTLICYDRTCFASKTEEDVRITMDEHIRYRIANVDLHEDGTEKSFRKGIVMMEIKAMDRYPMWLVDILSEMKLYRSSFSKFGTIYQTNFETMSPLNNRSYVSQRTEENTKPLEKEEKLCSIHYSM